MKPDTRQIKNVAKLGLRLLFEGGQRLGVDILPRHFYSEIPDLRLLRRSDHWKRPFSMVGVAGADIGGQLEFLDQQVSPAVRDALRAHDVHAEASAANGEAGYGRVEAEVLYAFIRTRQPRTIFQIGCGVSTAVCLQAAKDGDYRPEIICVEPYPTPYLCRMAEQRAITLVRKKAEHLEPSHIGGLGADLLFFVDSTHTLGPGGEVSRIVLEMLPRLKARAYVHFHDIMFPYDYPRDVLDRALVFQHESALLHAFLAYNSRFALRVALSMIHYQAPERLGELFESYRPAGNEHGLETRPGHFPSAAYLQVTS